MFWKMSRSKIELTINTVFDNAKYVTVTMPGMPVVGFVCLKSNFVSQRISIINFWQTTEFFFYISLPQKLREHSWQRYGPRIAHRNFHKTNISNKHHPPRRNIIDIKCATLFSKHENTMTYDFENRWNPREIISYRTFSSSFLVWFRWKGGGRHRLCTAGASCDGRPVDIRSTTPRALDNVTPANILKNTYKSRCSYVSHAFGLLPKRTRTLVVPFLKVDVTPRTARHRVQGECRRQTWRHKHNGHRSVSSANTPDFTQKWKSGQTPKCVYVWGKETWRSMVGDRNALCTFWRD